MEEILNEAVYLAGVLVPFIVAFVEVIKRVSGDVKHLPFISIGVGLVAGLLFGWQLEADLFVYGLTGLIAGLSASGLYDGIKTTAVKVKGDVK